MQTEIEVKFTDVDFGDIRKKLGTLGATCEQPMRLMRRAITETPELEAKNAYLRVRDEGNKITLTYKQFDEISLTGAKEIELEVSSFDAMVGILEQVGLSHKSLQESRRETWHLGDVEVVLDEWPGLSPYIEVEGPTEKKVKEVSTRLGFSWDDAVFGKVSELYQRQYPDGNASLLVTIPELTFDHALPAIITGEK